jgi:hypothetical protein
MPVGQMTPKTVKSSVNHANGAQIERTSIWHLPRMGAVKPPNLAPLLLE